MCTAITMQSARGEHFFGRTMDFSYDIEPQLYVVPKDYVWSNSLNRSAFHSNYSFIGIGQETDGILGFFDGVNERGFAAAVLYFAGYAQFDTLPPQGRRQPVAALDLLHYLLGQCGAVAELPRILANLSIVGVPDPVTKTVAPLHWIAADRTGACVVIEQTAQGRMLHQNPIGVMANSPDFPWHMTNLRNYMGVTPTQENEAQWGKVRLKPFGQGAGTMLLPGGYTSPERFVRAAYLKTHCPPPQNSLDTVNACFHIMESVSIPRGAVISERDTSDYTKYTAFIDINACTYFFRTYDNLQIGTASLQDNHRFVSHPIHIDSLARPVSFQTLQSAR